MLNQNYPAKVIIYWSFSLFRQVTKICFPQAAVIADKYHVMRQVCCAEGLLWYA